MLLLPDCPACLIVGVNLTRPYQFIPYDFPDDLVHGEIVDDDDDASSSCEWVNEDCPGECSTVHDAPDYYDDGMWSCPDTGARYRYCVDCGWEVMVRWSNQPTNVNGEWYCDPYEHGWSSCDGCGEYVDEQSTIYSDRYESYMCESCYEDESSPGESVTTCRTCNTPNIHLDEYTENFVCRCAADRLRLERKPVLVAA